MDDTTGVAPLGFSLGALFPPGTVLLGRYRIVFPLGRGGMGEVYRADDLKLGHPVALKFLPEAVAREPGTLERFHSEVRHAREIAHPNVCRVHDIGEVDGRHFLSMEYVDGEDLASLLRRIGRLPPNKALEIARELCAGLAAAHAQGLIHRDLKPGNILIDGRGRARIADFGLAARADQTASEVAGTPPYMAPELFLGRGASVQSDIYALGVVFYELFTGRRPFEGTGLAAWRRAHLDEAPARPSLFVLDMDPEVERVILRCLDKRPTDRPSSIRVLAASLPGGDLLDAALAAGQTPAPDVVAAAGGAGVLPQRTATILLATAVLGIVGFAAIAPGVFQYGAAEPAHPPRALADAAREALRHAGDWRPPAYSLFHFQAGEGAFDRTVGRGRAPFPSRGRDDTELRFLYRESPMPLAPYDLLGLVTSFDPPSSLPRMGTVELDRKGRLVWLIRIPEGSPAGTADAEVRFDTLFELAGLERSQFARTEPHFVPPVGFDSRHAWIEADGRRRVEAASAEGQVVSFAVLPATAEPFALPSRERRILPRLADAAGPLILLIALAAGGLLARRNLRLHRGDREGAFRLAAFEVTTLSLWWLLRAYHVAEFRHAWVALTVGVGSALFWGGFLWIAYMALEPWIRRQSPKTLVSWARIVGGQARDPLVGRDALIGLALAVPVIYVMVGAEMLAGTSAPRPTAATEALGSLSWSAAGFFWSIHTALFMTLSLLLLLQVLQLLLRKRSLAVVVCVAVAILPGLSGESTGLIQALAQAVVVSLLLFALTRFGVLSATVLVFVVNLPVCVPLTLDASAWYAGPSFLVLSVTTAFAVQAWRISRGGSRTP